MEWPRVKNILIVLLAMVNVFLFAVYITSTIKDARGVEETIQNTVSVLNERGFKIEENRIPKKGSVLYPISAERNRDEEEKIAKRFIGKSGYSKTSGVTDVHKSELGEARFRADGSFEITLKSAISHNDEAALARLVAKQMNIKVSDEIHVADKNGNTHIAAMQTHLGIPVYNCKINIAVMSDKSMRIYGKRLASENDVLRGNPPQDITGILINLIEILNNNGVTSGEINAITGGFNIMSGTGNAHNEILYAVPIWKISIDDRDIYINAMNGKSMNIE